MIFNCKCGSQVHLSTNARPDDLPINLMCFHCFKEEGLKLYAIEYDFPPLRAINWSKVFARNHDDAMDILKQLKQGIRIRDCIDISNRFQDANS